jgi:hypothetical protein
MTRTTTYAAAPDVINEARWPGIGTAAGSPLRAAVARALFTTAVARLPLRVHLPDGRRPDGRMLGIGGPDAPG